MNVRILVAVSLLCAPIFCADFVRPAIGALTRHAKNILDNSADTQCSRDLRTLLFALEKKEMFAIKMVDATAKPTAGFFMGNIMGMGNYDECVAVRHGEIKGKYCMTVLSPAEKYRDELKFLDNGATFIRAMGIDFDRSNVTRMLDVIKWTWGVCIPASCRQNDIQQIANFTEMRFDSKLHVSFHDELCSYDDGASLPLKTVLFICFMAFIVALMILSTIYDVLIHQKQKPGVGVDLLVAFSIYSNGKKIFSLKAGEDNLGVVNGVRAFSLAWVIFGHTYMANFYFPSINSAYIFEWKNDLSSVLVLAAPLAVDTFFAISGFLVIYLYLTVTVTKRMNLSLSMFYIHRILRLTPPLFVLVMFYICLFEHMGSGPYWFTVKKLYVQNCERYWWTTIFYIQNYYNSLNDCVTHAWYLSVDTQLYFMAPLVLYGLIRRARKTIFLLAIVFVISAVSAFLLTYIYQVGAVPFEAGEKYFYYLYHMTHIRGTVWIVGAVWGYALFKTKNLQLGLGRRTLFLLWTGNLLCMWIVMYAHLDLTRYSKKYDPFTAGIFNAVARPIWAMGVCWIMYSCIKGYGGFLNSFLSMRPFLVLCRLNYGMFLMHVPIMLIIVTQKRTVQYISNFNEWFDFVAYYVLTFVMSIFWVLAFESPVITFEKYLFRNGKEHLGKVSTLSAVMSLLSGAVSFLISDIFLWSVM